MKKQLNAFLLTGLILVSLAFSAHSQTNDTSLYHPYAYANEDIAQAIKQAKAQHKHVLIQVGGNWCSWCLLLQHFWTTDSQLDSVIQTDYVLYHLNYSKENKNLALLAKYGFPQRFGFPVLLILDGNGSLIHTQNTGLLEEGKGYNKGKVLQTLEQWSVQALDPAKYKDM